MKIPRLRLALFWVVALSALVGLRYCPRHTKISHLWGVELLVEPADSLHLQVTAVNERERTIETVIAIQPSRTYIILGGEDWVKLKRALPVGRWFRVSIKKGNRIEVDGLTPMVVRVEWTTD